jgi:predicted DNA-binding transcriptional regulator AlpA
MKYTRGNKFAIHISLADATVDWESLTPEEEAQVTLVGEPPLPALASRPDLHARALALHDAVQRGAIRGEPIFDKVELPVCYDGSPQLLGYDHNRLDRASVAKWIAETDARLVQEARDRAKAKRPAFSPDSAAKKPALPVLLDEKQILAQLGISATTLKRRRKSGEFPAPTHANPNRWPESVVADHLESQRIHPDPTPAAVALASAAIQSAQDRAFGDDEDLI